MRKKWEPSSVILTPHQISATQFNQILETLGEIIYSHLHKRQLQKIVKANEPNISDPISDASLKRTGTHD